MNIRETMVPAFTLALVTVLLTACGAPGPIMPDGRTGSGAIPGQASPAAYRVIRGDTLYSIAFRYGLDWREIAGWNGIAPPYTIRTGQTLRLHPPPAAAGQTRTASSNPDRLPGETRGIGAPPRSVESRTIASGTSGSGAPSNDEASVPLPPITTSTPTPAGETGSAPERRPGVAAAPPPAANAETNISTSGAGRTVAGATWFWPTEGRLSRRFNANDARKGIHIAGEGGQAIRSTANGEVVYSGNGLIGYGELIIIKHTDSMLSAYAHNRERLVEQGDRVQAGQQIARMGEFEPNRPLLHFEIRRNGQPDDPLKYLPNRSF